MSWEEFQRIQEMISANCRGPGRSGAARKGAGLLSGILRCRRCGRKLAIHYTGRDHDVLRYSCIRGWLDNADPRCIAFGGIPVDGAIAREILRVVQPAAVEVAVLAARDASRRQHEVLEALHRDLEAAQYAAQRAWRQFDAADPENRLVADELERRWNQALQRAREIEERIAQQRGLQYPVVTPSLKEFEALAADLESVWSGGHADVRLKKRIVRTLIEEVVVDVDAAAGKILLTIHWKGGVHTELRVPRRRRGQCTHTSKETVEAVRLLARTCTDDVIAGVLNRNALRTGRGNRWTRERVTSLRSTHKIACYDPQQRTAEGWMNLSEAAKFLGVSSRTLRLAVEQGDIPGEHPLTDGPWIFDRRDLESDAATRVVARVRRHQRTPAVPTSEQETFDFSGT